MAPGIKITICHTQLFNLSKETKVVEWNDMKKIHKYIHASSSWNWSGSQRRISMPFALKVWLSNPVRESNDNKKSSQLNQYVTLPFLAALHEGRGSANFPSVWDAGNQSLQETCPQLHCIQRLNVWHSGFCEGQAWRIRYGRFLCIFSDFLFSYTVTFYSIAPMIYQCE